MINNILLFDDMLNKSIHTFKQYEDSNKEALIDDGMDFLEEARQMIHRNSYITHGTKWGSCVEYFTQKFDLDINTDDILYELDVFINNMLNINTFIRPSVQDALWIGDYSLLRFINGNSHLRYLAQKTIHNILLYYINLFDTSHNQSIFIEPLFFLPSTDCSDLKKWINLLMERDIYIKDANILLDKILTLEQNPEFMICRYKSDPIRLEIRSLFNFLN